jgi:hypothetical protein
VGSLRIDGVRSVAYPQDHEPMHVYGFCAETEAIIELREVFVGGRVVWEVTLADRKDAVRPGDAKRADVKHILSVAAERFDELTELWREAHV